MYTIIIRDAEVEPTGYDEDSFEYYGEANDDELEACKWNDVKPDNTLIKLEEF